MTHWLATIVNSIFDSTRSTEKPWYASTMQLLNFKSSERVKINALGNTISQSFKK